MNDILEEKSQIYGKILVSNNVVHACFIACAASLISCVPMFLIVLVKVFGLVWYINRNDSEEFSNGYTKRSFVVH